MANKPILFSASMVAAILDGRKTQTRRTIKGSTEHKGNYNPVYLEVHKNSRGWKEICPYGKIGDTLWVREEHYAVGHWEKNSTTKTGKQKWKFVPDIGGDVRYSDNPPADFMVSRSKEYPDVNLWYKRLARFMPRSLSRIKLEIVDIRVEKLKDISQKDAISEGAPPSHHSIDKVSREIGNPDFSRSWFAQLWQSINGTESWDENPWVWVISFKVVDVKDERRAA